MIDVRHDEQAGRFVATIDGVHAGFADFEDRGDGTVLMDHTVVDPVFEGRGVGSALARSALDHLRSTGGRVIPSCWFIAGWIERHPDYEELRVV